MHMGTPLKYLARIEVGAAYSELTDDNQAVNIKTPDGNMIKQPLKPLFFGCYVYDGRRVTAVARNYGSYPIYTLFNGDEALITLTHTTKNDDGIVGGRQMIQMEIEPTLDLSGQSTIPPELFRLEMLDYDTELRKLVLPLLDGHAIWQAHYGVNKGRDYGEERTRQLELWMRLFGAPYRVDGEYSMSRFHLGLQREIGMLLIGKHESEAI